MTMYLLQATAATGKVKQVATDQVELLPGLQLPVDVAPIVSWALLVLSLLGLLMLVFMPLMLLGIKKANKHTEAAVQELGGWVKKVAEWSEYTGSQVEEMVVQTKQLNETSQAHATAGRKRTQAQAAQAVQLGKLLQQQIEAIERSR